MITIALSVEQAEHLAAVLADAGRPELEPILPGMMRVHLTAEHLDVLRGLPAKEQWHLDARGYLWIGHSDYPLTDPAPGPPQRERS